MTVNFRFRSVTIKLEISDRVSIWNLLSHTFRIIFSSIIPSQYISLQSNTSSFQKPYFLQDIHTMYLNIQQAHIQQALDLAATFIEQDAKNLRKARDDLKKTYDYINDGEDSLQEELNQWYADEETIVYNSKKFLDEDDPRLFHDVEEFQDDDLTLEKTRDMIAETKEKLGSFDDFAELHPNYDDYYQKSKELGNLSVYSQNIATMIKDLNGGRKVSPSDLKLLVLNVNNLPDNYPIPADYPVEFHYPWLFHYKERLGSFLNEIASL